MAKWLPSEIFFDKCASLGVEWVGFPFEKENTDVWGGIDDSFLLAAFPFSSY